jgi:hypothetical protein
MTYPIDMRVFMVSNAVWLVSSGSFVVLFVSHSILSSITVPILYTDLGS